MLALADHDPRRVLARTKSGTLRLSEDTRGLAFDMDVPNTTAGRDILELAERSDLGGMSFGFTVAKDGERWQGDRRELRSITLHEISVVSAWPAYEGTLVQGPFPPDRRTPPLRCPSLDGFPMNIIRRIFSPKGENRSTPTSWDLLASLGFPTATGQMVSPALVEGNAAAFNAIQVISEAVGSLPPMVYRKGSEGTREAETGHPVAHLFTDTPNDLQTPTEFITMMQANCLVHGAAYAEIIRDQEGAPVALWPLHPGQVSIERIPRHPPHPLSGF